MKPHCEVYDHGQVFHWQLWYVFFYFVGLNFTHMNMDIFSQFYFEWEAMKNWPWYLWATCALLFAFLALNLVYLFFLYKKA